jgi:hypothetical protein
MELRFERRPLYLKETFSIAYGNYDKREALLIELSHQIAKVTENVWPSIITRLIFKVLF